jgi:uncharacterized membrane protein
MNCNGTPPAPVRLQEIDLLRGFLVALMALDHTRDFFGVLGHRATDLSVATHAEFLTRWITHVCAPCFVFLAGTGAYLYMKRSGSAGETARFLLVRGAMLVVIEQTLLRCLGWYFNCDYRYMNANVLFGIGCSMVLLAGMVRLPARALLVAGIAVTALHGLSGFVEFTQGGHSRWAWAAAWAWTALFRSGDIEYRAGYHLYISYPVIPWLGIMAAGFGTGFLFEREAGARQRTLLVAGLAMLASCTAIRALYLQLHPGEWYAGASALHRFFSFINMEKYPPSLPFTLMTLGIGSLLFPALGLLPGRIRSPLALFGSVPLFFYLLHIPVIHLSAVVYSRARFGEAHWLLDGPVIFWHTPLQGAPAGYGLPLWLIYAIWGFFLALLYPLCRRYALMKFRTGFPWMKYL